MKIQEFHEDERSMVITFLFLIVSRHKLYHFVRNKKLS